ncbi:MAG: hypothetical protein NVS1B14_01740 [Vulcanimicrobiaceae bacterium]
MSVQTKSATPFELIEPFLRPISKYLHDEDVTEICVNADGRVYVERDGRMEDSAVVMSERERDAAARTIARLLGNDIDEIIPLLDARLPDGSRIAAVLGGVSVGGTVLSIRKFRAERWNIFQLVDRGMLTLDLSRALGHAIEQRQTILISGGTGAGKTTLLNALSAYLPPPDRVVLIEDTAEIALDHRNLVRLEARREIDGVPTVTIRELLRQALRLRPDRIILGEVRGAEAFDLLQALNTGHEGTLSTIHANSARMALSRLRGCVAMANAGLPDAVVARNIADVVQVVVQIERRAGVRRVCEVASVEGYDAAADAFVLRGWDVVG